MKYLEFVEFWVAGETKLVCGTQGGSGFDAIELSDSFGGGHNKLLEVEESILEHFSKVINQREISLWECFKLFDD